MAIGPHFVDVGPDALHGVDAKILMRRVILPHSKTGAQAQEGERSRSDDVGWCSQDCLQLEERTLDSSRLAVLGPGCGVPRNLVRFELFGAAQLVVAHRED